MKKILFVCFIFITTLLSLQAQSRLHRMNNTNSRIDPGTLPKELSAIAITIESRLIGGLWYFYDSLNYTSVIYVPGEYGEPPFFKFMDFSGDELFNFTEFKKGTMWAAKTTEGDFNLTILKIDSGFIGLFQCHCGNNDELTEKHFTFLSAVDELSSTEMSIVAALTENIKDGLIISGFLKK